MFALCSCQDAGFTHLRELPPDFYKATTPFRDALSKYCAHVPFQGEPHWLLAPSWNLGPWADARMCLPRNRTPAQSQGQSTLWLWRERPSLPENEHLDLIVGQTMHPLLMCSLGYDPESQQLRAQHGPSVLPPTPPRGAVGWSLKCASREGSSEDP